MFEKNLQKKLIDPPGPWRVAHKASTYILGQQNDESDNGITIVALIVWKSDRWPLRVTDVLVKEIIFDS